MYMYSYNHMYWLTTVIILSQSGRTPLDRAIMIGHDKVVDVLLQSGAKVSYHVASYMQTNLHV